ncbi:X-ray repair cross-complementing protein 5 isoform X2 [Anarrhichthys ocellatus]|uniref:X-ray repair cross-complementing protein 5 isoform X2 n=1 Tax=Anarrhichthys ocellatus TaxID=433405 RepID=UPI0012ED06F9|nr:X-ray repair cross-complementing protein 5 isoform X2 [Anarrhichthys ocellatus]
MQVWYFSLNRYSLIYGEQPTLRDRMVLCKINAEQLPLETGTTSSFLPFTVSCRSHNTVTRRLRKREKKKMAGAKSALVLCMDVGFSMSNSAPGEEPPFELAKKVIQKFVQRQVFAETKDELALVLFGTDSTKNSLEQDGQYQNITVHRNLMMPDFELLEEIENQIHPESQQADWLDALVVCMDLLKTETQGKRCDRLNISLLTDLNTQASSEQLDVIIDNLKQADITVQFFLPFPAEEDGEGGGDPDGGSGGHPGAGKDLSGEQQSGLDMVKHISLSLNEEDGLDQIYSFRNAIEQLCMFKRVERRPMAWPCQLTIGSCLPIRIVGYKAVTEEKLKKMWTTVDAQTNKRDDVKRETVYCLDDDNETEVQKDDTIQGFRYGSDIVPFSKVDQEQMKYKHDGKCFAVLGFAKENSVRRHQFMGTQAIKVFPAKDDEHAGVALSALIRALDELNMVAIVRYAYDRRSNPQVGAAFPCIKRNYECLIYVQLPFMEDLRQFTFPSLENNKRFTASDTQLSAVDSLIDSMMLEEDDNGDKKDMFKVHHIPNPSFQRHFQCLHHRAVSPDTPLPPMEPWLKAALERPDVVAERCQGPLEELKKKFPLVEVEKKKKPKTSAQIFGKDSEEPDAKKAKGDEEEEDYSFADIAEGSVTSVGSVDPAKDFRTLIKKKSLPFGEVCQQLTRRIEQLLGNKDTQYYMKSITCIQAFREQSVKLEDANLYNGYLQSLKRSIPNRGLEVFWDLLVQDAITLISKDEVEGSAVSKSDANQFLVTEEKKEEAAAPPAADTGDVDDLASVISLILTFFSF